MAEPVTVIDKWAFALIDATPMGRALILDLIREYEVCSRIGLSSQSLAVIAEAFTRTVDDLPPAPEPKPRNWAELRNDITATLAGTSLPNGTVDRLTDHVVDVVKRWLKEDA